MDIVTLVRITLEIGGHKPLAESRHTPIAPQSLVSGFSGHLIGSDAMGVPLFVSR